eukprot:scaffold22378_cov70-Phaeocystis_antarctica.AAC.2
MGWVTRLGAKGPANVARFRGGTASQRCLRNGPAPPTLAALGGSSSRLASHTSHRSSIAWLRKVHAGHAHAVPCEDPCDEACASPAPATPSTFGASIIVMRVGCLVLQGL